MVEIGRRYVVQEHVEDPTAPVTEARTHYEVDDHHFHVVWQDGDDLPSSSWRPTGPITTRSRRFWRTST